MKGSNTAQWPLEWSQNKGLSEYQRKVNQLHMEPSLPRGREAGEPQSEPEGKGLLQSWLQRPPNCDQAPSCKTCLPGNLEVWRLPGVSQPEISSPEETHGTPETVLSWHTGETEWTGLGRWLRYMAQLGQGARQAPVHLSCSDLKRAQNAQPIQVCGLAEYPRTWVA